MSFLCKSKIIKKLYLYFFFFIIFYPSVWYFNSRCSNLWIIIIFIFFLLF